MTDRLTPRGETPRNLGASEHLRPHKRRKREVSSGGEERGRRKTGGECLAESIDGLTNAFNASITARQEEGKTDFKRSVETLVAEFDDRGPLFIYRASQALEKGNNATVFNSLKNAEDKRVILEAMMTSIASIDL